MRMALLIIGAILIPIAAFILLQSKGQRRTHQMELPLALFLGYAATRSALSPDPAALPYLTILAAQTAAYLWLTRKPLIDLLAWLYALAAIITIESHIHILARLAGIEPLWVGNTPGAWRVSLWACDWMVYTQILLLAIPYLIQRMLSKNGFPIWGITLTLTTALFFSGQRAAWLAWATILLILTLTTTQWWQRIALTSIILWFSTLYLTAAPLVLADRIVFAGRDISPTQAALTITMGRQTFADLALDLLESNPILGTGAYHYDNGTYQTYHAHNLALDLLARYGLLGALLATFAISEAMRRKWNPSVPLALFATIITLGIFGNVYWILYLGAITHEPPKLATANQHQHPHPHPAANHPT